MSSRRPVIRRRTGPPPTSEGGPASDASDILPESDFLDLPLGKAEPESDLGFGSPADAEVDPEPSDDPRRPGYPGYPGSSGNPRNSGYSGYSGNPGYSEKLGRERPATPRPSRWPYVIFVLLLPLAAAAGYFLRPLPPVVTVSADLIDFGDVRLGETATGRLGLGNDGESALEVKTVEILDDPDGAVAQIEGTCGSRALAARENCELALAFTPKRAESFRARLRLVTNAPDGERTVPLLGRGVAPQLTVEPARLDLGQATVGERGGRGQLRLGNRGSAPVRVHAVSLEGLGAADFVRFDDRCAGGELAPGAACTVGFEFVPTAAGARQASVRFDAAAPVPISPELFGRGLPQLPELALAPDRVDFGPQRLGARTAPVEIVLRNDGNGPLDVRRVRVVSPRESGAAGPSATSSASLAESFVLEDLGCAPKRLEPGSSCRLLVAFEPAAEGPLGAVVEVEHSAAPGIHRLPLVGLGTAPRAAVSPAQLAFGEVPVGRESDWQRLEVRNVGSADLHLSTMTLQGADAGAFELSADGCLRLPVPPAESCSAELRFRARRDGPHRAEVKLTHDAGDGLDSVPINGLGISARLGLDPVALDFGDVTLGTTRRLELVLRSTGRAALRVERLRLEGDGLELERDCAGKVLPAGGSCTLAVRATPQEVGTVRGRLVIEHDGADSPREALVTLNARPRPRPELLVETPRLSFTERYLGERSPIETVTLRNKGTARLELREMEIEGDEAGDFQLVPGSCASFLPPATACTVGVAFEPRGAGPRSAILTVRHDAPGGTARVPLYGLGVDR